MSDPKAEFLENRACACTLHVCVSCRPSNFPREPKENRPGFRLHRELERLIKARNYSDLINLESTECLSLCPRPCGIAISSQSGWTYLFGDQDANLDAQAIIDCVISYSKEPTKPLARHQRPKNMRASILGRVPP